MLSRLRDLLQLRVDADLSTASGRAVVEERYWSLRRQVPIIYLLGLVNLSAMELATGGTLGIGMNLPTFVAACGVLRLIQWFGPSNHVPHSTMVSRMRQTVWFATAVCTAVCLRCLYLLQVGDAASHMAVMLFGGLTAIGVAYGLTALPAAGRIPLLLIIAPISIAALVSKEPEFAGAAFGLVVVAALTMRLLNAHSAHFTDVILSRSRIAHEQQKVEHAHQEAVVAATTDFLTGLPNRRAFVAALEAAANEEHRRFVVAILDLDRFKAVNDTFGHAAGDQLLKCVADRLIRVIGTRGIVSRLGGDEFGILVPNIKGSRHVQLLGSEILEGVNGSVHIDGRRLVISACCGLALSRPTEGSPSRIMADADLALYQAKENPADRKAVFEERMEAPRRRRTQIESALLAPGVDVNFSVVFQPIFDLRSGRVLAHEALARWIHPVLGPVSPSEFVPIAEHLNLIEDLTARLMRRAFEKAREWPDQVKLSFNLSAIQLCSRDSARSVLRALRRSALSPARLQVEVTETALLADFECARDNLNALRKAGATIVLDDFGAGYASIGYLRELRFDQIKLDGGLVTAAQHSVDGKRLLRAVVGLCDMLDVATVAEHVESEELLTLVRDLGCSAGQGFWLGRPVPAEELDQPSAAAWPLLNEHRRRRAA
ncbi:MAG: putative bifunctional diguanylate cyclase/phosphodiesterase [Sphingomicrobium sp.]